MVARIPKVIRTLAFIVYLFILPVKKKRGSVEETQRAQLLFFVPALDKYNGDPFWK